MHRPKALFILLISLFVVVTIQAAQPQNKSPEDAIKAGLAADPATNVHAHEEYAAAIRQLFAQQNYEEIERLASDSRKNRERFSGGAQKITSIYFALGMPKPADSDADWDTHLERLKAWKNVSADVLTPTLALATFYENYAFHARGYDTADTVSPQAFQAFQDRIAAEHKLLSGIADRRTEDPAWFELMLSMARFEGWDKAKERKLFDEAIAYDPTYRLYYRNHSTYLQPQWSGDDGDITRFANEMYERIGPVEGPIEYFEIAGVNACNCGPQYETNKLSMTKIKEGFTLSAQHYGPSFYQMNQMAYITYFLQDPVGLADMLAQIGDNIDDSAWHGNGRENVDRAREWLASNDPGGPPRDTLEEEMKTSEGQNYAKLIQADFDRKYADILTVCRKEAGDEAMGFWFVFKQDGTGKLSAAFGYPQSELLACFGQKALQEKPTFIAPPHADYWSKVVVH